MGVIDTRVDRKILGAASKVKVNGENYSELSSLCFQFRTSSQLDNEFAATIIDIINSLLAQPVLR